MVILFDKTHNIQTVPGNCVMLDMFYVDRNEITIMRKHTLCPYIVIRCEIGANCKA